MMKFYKSTKVKALATTPFTRSDVAASASHDEPLLNPVVFSAGRKRFDRRPKKGLSRPCQSYKLATLNCISPRSASSQAELNKLMHVYNAPIICIQEHCHVHSNSEPDIVARSIGTSTIFTASAVRNEQNASVGGVAITINSKLLPLLESVKKLDERIVRATFKGNPKTVIISCYSPHNVVNFFIKLSNAVKDIPPHAMLIIGGDMNAQVANGFSLHDKTNRKGHHLVDFIQQHNLII